METLLFHFSIIKLLSYWLATLSQVRTSDCKGAKVQPLNSTSQCVQCILGQYAKAFIGQKVLWTNTHWSEFSSPHLRCSAGNNSRSSDIVRPNFENVRPISHYDRTRWPNISPAHLECCQSINDVRSNLSNVRPKWRFDSTYVLWIKKNYFQHCIASPDTYSAAQR